MSNPLFKAKTHKGEWVYGYYYEQGDKAYILQDGKAYEVRQETRCQYVGKIEDKDIYVHDIILGTDIDTIVKGEIIWVDEHYKYVLKERYGFCVSLNGLVGIKVVGNKFDK